MKDLAMQMNSELDAISAQQDKTTDSVLKMYKQQLDTANALSLDKTFSADDRSRFFDMSRQIIDYIKEEKDKVDKRKEKDKNRKVMTFLGIAVPLGASVLSISIKVIANAINRAKI